MVIVSEVDVLSAGTAVSAEKTDTTIAQTYQVGAKETATFVTIFVGAPIVGGIVGNVVLGFAKKFLHFPTEANTVGVLTVVETFAMGAAEAWGMRRWFRRQDRLETEYNAARRRG